LNIDVSRNRFCDFLADPGSRNFSRFTLILTGAGTGALLPTEVDRLLSSSDSIRFAAQGDDDRLYHTVGAILRILLLCFGVQLTQLVQCFLNFRILILSRLQKTFLFECFPYVYPEPVLVK
jgi:hypothetical protein